MIDISITSLPSIGAFHPSMWLCRSLLPSSFKSLRILPSVISFSNMTLRANSRMTTNNAGDAAHINSGAPKFGPIDLFKGWPNPSLLPPHQLDDASAHILSNPTNTDVLFYGPDEGYEPLREEIAKWLNDFYKPSAPITILHAFCKPSLIQSILEMFGWWLPHTIWRAGFLLTLVSTIG